MEIVRSAGMSAPPPAEAAGNRPDPPAVEGEVSAVVCTRNRPALLERCLSSLIHLSPAPGEVIVVDQSEGSESRRVVEGYAGRIGNLRHLPTSSRGLSRARNEGISAARGEIIAFTDDDCLARTDWIGQAAGALREHPEAAVITGGTLPDPRIGTDEIAPRILAAITWHPEEKRLFQGKIDPSLAGGGLNFAVRRSWIRRVGGFDPDLGPGGRFRGADDTDFLYRILRSGGAILYHPDVVVSHLPWREEENQSAVEYEYGHGIAAWALKWAGKGDLFPAWTAVKVLLGQARRAVGGAVRGDRVAARTGGAYLSGLGKGAMAWILARGGAAPGTPGAEAAPHA
jgi:GT2 family glycosyltransferase